MKRSGSRASVGKFQAISLRFILFLFCNLSINVGKVGKYIKTAGRYVRRNVGESGQKPLRVLFTTKWLYNQLVGAAFKYLRIILRAIDPISVTTLTSVIQASGLVFRTDQGWSKAIFDHGFTSKFVGGMQ